jgi:hypothetical protein
MWTLRIRKRLSAYECGFNAFDDARMKFDIRFYLVAILFIIFDLEVAFLFPVGRSSFGVGVFGFWSMMVFPGRADRRISSMNGKRERWNGIDRQARQSAGLIDPDRRTAVDAETIRFSASQRRAGRQGLSRHLHRRPHQLGAHRLADVDDLWPGLLRGGDDACLDAALRRWSASAPRRAPPRASPT